MVLVFSSVREQEPNFLDASLQYFLESILNKYNKNSKSYENKNKKSNAKFLIPTLRYNTLYYQLWLL